MSEKTTKPRWTCNNSCWQIFIFYFCYRTSKNIFFRKFMKSIPLSLNKISGNFTCLSEGYHYIKLVDLIWWYVCWVEPSYELFEILRMLTTQIEFALLILIINLVYFLFFAPYIIKRDNSILLQIYSTLSINSFSYI